MGAASFWQLASGGARAQPPCRLSQSTHMLLLVAPHSSAATTGIL